MAYKDLNAMPDEDKMSRINAAGIINITIENLWKDSYSSMAQGKFMLCNSKLDSIWVILGGDVKKEGPEEKAFNKLDLELHNLGSLTVKKIGFDELKIDNTLRAKQYLLLRQKSLFLRRLQNSQGKGTAYHDGDESDWE